MPGVAVILPIVIIKLVQRNVFGGPDADTISWVSPFRFYVPVSFSGTDHSIDVDIPSPPDIASPLPVTTYFCLPNDCVVSIGLFLHVRCYVESDTLAFATPS